jgi:5'-3' exonuclease
MDVHLVDATYELFRAYHAPRPPVHGREGMSLGAVAGLVDTLLFLLRREGASHVGCAHDRVIRSFRNDLWPGYKTSAGVERSLLAQFQPLEDALAAMGIPVWPMIELEADDALASAACLAVADVRVDRVCIWTPDKDLAQCVRGDRVVQVNSRTGTIRDADAVRKKFGVEPGLIPDYLALVGDAADGFPGIPGIGPVTAARLLNRYGGIEELPSDILQEGRGLALLFKDLATLRTNASLFTNVDDLEWRGPVDGFSGWAERIGDADLLERCRAIQRDRDA